MPKLAKELSSLEVKRLEHPGKGRNATFAVGGVSGLLLQITPNGGRSWVLRTKVGDKRREIGLGGYPSVTLAQAREKAREARLGIEGGKDPVAERKAARSALTAAQRMNLTFEEAVERCLASKLDAFKNDKHRKQWAATLKTYAVPELGSTYVNDIAVQDVLRVLEPIWLSKTETASRLRGRIEAVLSWATVAGHRTGDNPARWSGNLKELLPAPNKVKGQVNHAALPIEDAPRWFEALRKRKGMGARALELLALTATRSGEVRGAIWSEVDLDRAIWTIPAQRTKTGKEHRVPLSQSALALLGDLPRLEGQELVFPASRGGQLSDMTLSATMRRIHEAEEGGFVDARSGKAAVPHGLRSTFRDWVAEHTKFPGDMAEVALGHKISNAVEAAYRRGDMVEKRRRMMDVWAASLNGIPQQNVKVVLL